MMARIPLVLNPQPEGGYTVTSPLLPELTTEGDTIAKPWRTQRTPLLRWWKSTRFGGGPLPSSIYMDDANGPVSIEAIVSVP